VIRWLRHLFMRRRRFSYYSDKSAAELQRDYYALLNGRGV